MWRNFSIPHVHRRILSFVAVLNFGLTRPEIEREAARLAKATILVIRH